MRSVTSLTLIFLQSINLKSALSFSPHTCAISSDAYVVRLPLSKNSRLTSTTLYPTFSLESAWASDIGFSALETVKGLARSVSKADELSDESAGLLIEESEQNAGNSGSYRPTPLYSAEEDLTNLSAISLTGKGTNERLVVSALAKLERDMAILDNIAGERPSLSRLELTLLSLAVGASATAPIMLPYKITEFLAPASAAFAAAIGIGAEFVGKVAVADGKEIAAKTLQCAAEAESYFAQAERTKALLPLCVGVGATGASFTLLVPTLIESFAKGNLELGTGLYFLCPLVSILAAAVSSLALLELQSQTARAISVGNRRFAKAGSVGRTWLSTYEQVEKNSKDQSSKWRSFAFSIIPGPILGCFIPGNIATRTIFVAAVAACQSAYYLAIAENTLARGQDAVALKSRSAAVCDSYANQGARSSAILPFTSALSSLCAAATAAIVEVPFVEGLGHTGASGILMQSGILALFPTLGSLFAAAASVSKARCEVDAEAATQAASTLALEYEMDGSVIGDKQSDPIIRPLRGVVELIRCTTRSGVRSVLQNSKIARIFVKPLIFRLRRMRARLMLKRKL